MRHIRTIVFLSALSFFFSCNTQVNTDDPVDEFTIDTTDSISPEHQLPDSLISFFTDKGLKDGTCIILHQNSGEVYVFNDSLSSQQNLPASTFKIFNSLVALETGVLDGPEHQLKWDGEKRFLDVWNQDHDLRSAIRYSVVWYYQELARRIGEEKMQYWIDTVGYGNGNISGGIDMFWLDGGLKISPREQIAFLDKLQKKELPFSETSQAIVKDIMILEEDSLHVFSGKTGWAMRDGSNTGWFVGFLEKADGNTYIFATMVKAGENVPEGFAASRLGITKDFLRYIEVYP